MIALFLRTWGGAFRNAARLVRALPLLVAVIVALEFAQHAVELRVGFFSPDRAIHVAAADHPLRLALGWPKMIALNLVAFAATRRLLAGEAPLRPAAEAMRRHYLWVMALELIPAAIIIHAPAIVAALGVGAGSALPLRVTTGLALQLAEPALFLWFANAAAGTRGVGPVASAQATRWLYPWALLLMLAARLPLAQLHGRLNLWAVGQTTVTQWGLLALDALVVGVLALVVPAAQLGAARVIAARRARPLLVDAPAT